MSIIYQDWSRTVRKALENREQRADVNHGVQKLSGMSSGLGLSGVQEKTDDFVSLNGIIVYQYTI
jgi:hypothetical protein